MFRKLAGFGYHSNSPDRPRTASANAADDDDETALSGESMIKMIAAEEARASLIAGKITNEEYNGMWFVDDDDPKATDILASSSEGTPPVPPASHSGSPTGKNATDTPAMNASGNRKIVLHACRGPKNLMGISFSKDLVVGSVRPFARQYGWREGQRICSVNGSLVNDFNSLAKHFRNRRQSSFNVTVIQGDEPEPACAPTLLALKSAESCLKKAAESTSLESEEGLPRARSLRVLICSWNMGNANPKTLSPLVPEGGGGADIVAIGMQESTFGMGGGDQFVGDLMTQALGSGYYRVAKAKLLEMKLHVFALKELKQHIRNVWTTSRATGIAGVYGNKGGLVVSLEVQNIPICFVSAHLAAHRAAKFLKHRNENVRTIISAILHKHNEYLTETDISDAPQDDDNAHDSHSSHSSIRKGRKDAPLGLLHKFAHVFWMGDLNYRVDPEHLPAEAFDCSIGGDLTTATIHNNNNAHSSPHFTHSSSAPQGALLGTHSSRPQHAASPLSRSLSSDSSSSAMMAHAHETQARGESWCTKDKKKWTAEKLRAWIAQWLQVHLRVQRQQWAALLAADQLTRAMASGDIFHGWNALVPNFAPTFKLARVRGNTYMHQRLPSYCDRILHISRPAMKHHVSCERFESVPAMETSDHKPVRAMMRLHLPLPPPPRPLAPPQARNGVARWPVLRIWNIEARGMCHHEHPTDTYLAFHTIPAVTEQAQTGVVKCTTDPKWTGINEMELHIDSRAELSNIDLVFEMLEPRDTILVTTDALFGLLTIPLDSLLRPAAQVTHHLSKYSIATSGTLSFKAAIFWPDAVTGTLHRCWATSNASPSVAGRDAVASPALCNPLTRAPARSTSKVVDTNMGGRALFKAVLNS